MYCTCFKHCVHVISVSPVCFRFSDINLESQELYQRELVQHGKTMEELTLLRMEMEDKGKAELEARNEREKVTAELQSVMVSL